jgi:hypothetical protein
MEVNEDIKEKAMDIRVSALESRVRLMARGYAILLVVLIVALYVSFHTHSNLSEITKESAHQRVITVEQRCNLTMLITEVLAKDDPKRVEAFEKSYDGCQTQLKKVKEIAKRTE